MQKITWSQSKGRGRGIFALAPLAAHEVLEVSPINIISEPDSATSALDAYNIEWHEGESCIGFGYLMLYNHSDDPNVIFVRNFDSKTISVVARRNILSGEELTYDYGIPLWFENTKSPEERISRVERILDSHGIYE